MKRFAGLVAVGALVFTVACGQTDAGISTAVKTKFAANDLVKAHQINVDTRDHVVTLSGDVDSLTAKAEAVRVARDTDGVRDVIDQLTLKAMPTSATSGIESDIDAAGRSLEGAADRTGDALEHGAERTGDALERGANATRNAADRGANESRGALERGADATERGVKKGVEATKDGAEKVADGAKNVYGKVKDAVTDDNHDSNHNGR